MKGKTWQLLGLDAYVDRSTETISWNIQLDSGTCSLVNLNIDLMGPLWMVELSRSGNMYIVKPNPFIKLILKMTAQIQPKS